MTDQTAPADETTPATNVTPPATVEATQATDEPALSAAPAFSHIVGRARDPLIRALSLSWVPLTAAFLSLLLSIASIVISLRQPEVMLILPDQVRVSQGRPTGSAFVYLQPAFVSTGQNERVEVIRDMTLEVQPPAGERADFRWDEQARLVGDPDTGTLSYEYVADAVPLLVSPRSAAAPLNLFDAPEGWFFAPGTYTFTLVAHRVVASDPLRDSFSVTLGEDDVAFLDGPGASQFLAFPIR